MTEEQELDDMSLVTITKSDQLNAVDLLNEPRIITIRKVVLHKNAPQKASFFYEGDDNKPYKPCKGMRDIIMCKYGWGKKTGNYLGKSLELFHNPEVVYAGQAVGGIEISGMSDIEKDFTVSINVTKGKRKAVKIKKLALLSAVQAINTSTKPAPSDAAKLTAAKKKADEIIAEIQTSEDVNVVVEKYRDTLDRFEKAYPDLDAAINAALKARETVASDDMPDFSQ